MSRGAIIVVAVGIVLALVLGSRPSAALTLAACERTTHISHAGEDLHRDLGEGRVMWREWWSQEGTFETLVIADCAEARALHARTSEDGMRNPLPFDRTDKAVAAVEKAHQPSSRVFATLERVSEQLDKLSRDRVISPMAKESCACAAVYPEMRGGLMEFELGAGG